MKKLKLNKKVLASLNRKESTSVKGGIKTTAKNMICPVDYTEGICYDTDICTNTCIPLTTPQAGRCGSNNCGSNNCNSGHPYC